MLFPANVQCERVRMGQWLYDLHLTWISCNNTCNYNILWSRVKWRSQKATRTSSPSVHKIAAHNADSNYLILLVDILIAVLLLSFFAAIPQSRALILEAKYWRSSIHRLLPLAALPQIIGFEGEYQPTNNKKISPTLQICQCAGLT